MVLSRRTVLTAASASLCLATGGAASRRRQPPAVPTDAPLWTPDEQKAIQTYWNAPGRYAVEDAPADLPPRVNVTVAGSTWYAKYTSAAKTAAPAVSEAWGNWFKARLAFDKSQTTNKTAPTAPGPIPDDLKAVVGEPPASFYQMVQPKRYTVAFAPEDAPLPFVYTDAVPFADRKPYYAYLRSTNGVMKAGKNIGKLTGEEKAKADALFAAVASSPFEQHVLAAVSALEGGFEAINTYDTGWVSIGFIQFITAIGGNGSLVSVLARHKMDNPADFADTFHRFGIDVTPSRLLAVCEPAMGRELRGADAVQAIISDKRLTAVWERAGSLTSERGGRDGFRQAQVRIARQQYWPGDDLITVTVGANGETQTAKVSELVKSEAGMATLMDRKVNRGSLGPINEIATQIMQTNQLTKIEQLAAYEKPLIEGMKYRANYLTNPTLTQPPTPPPAPIAVKP